MLGEVLVDLTGSDIRRHVSEPDRGRRNWKDKEEAQAAVYANRRRLRSSRGQRLQNRRAELVERSFAALVRTLESIVAAFETGVCAIIALWRPSNTLSTPNASIISIRRITFIPRQSVVDQRAARNRGSFMRCSHELPIQRVSCLVLPVPLDLPVPAETLTSGQKDAHNNGTDYDDFTQLLHVSSSSGHSCYIRPFA